MDTSLIAFYGVVAAALLTGAFALSGTRKQTTQTGADEFRGDLLTRIGQQDTKIERLESKIESSLREIDRLRDELEDRDSHLVVVDRFIRANGLTPPAWVGEGS